MNCCATSGSIVSLRTVLIATLRSMCGSRALYTTPMAPLPRTASISYFPSFTGSSMLWRPLLLEHLHGLDQARLHAPQRSGQRADLVATIGVEFTGSHVAHADLVGDL